MSFMSETFLAWSICPSEQFVEYIFSVLRLIFYRFFIGEA
jgi:hypothetical protein